VRNTAVTQWVKDHHDFACQVCALRLTTTAGGYAEGAHIKPLGKPHNGPDAIDNVLCLCPNDHVRLDRGAIIIDENLLVIDRESGTEIGKLRTSREHTPNLSNVEYHRRLWISEG
jgi:putative restriction endonuclease